MSNLYIIMSNIQILAIYLLSQIAATIYIYFLTKIKIYTFDLR